MNQEITVKVEVDTVEEGGKIAGVEIGELNVLPPHFQARPENLCDAFDTFISSRAEGFLGRQFVFEELDAFIAQPESGYFIILGEPGIGKSALMAHLVKRRGYIHHFNIALQVINKPKQFLSSVCAQLIALFELDSSAVPNDAYESGVFLNQLLAKVSKKLKRDERLVIAIDALDEVDTTESASTRKYFILTGRPAARHLYRCDCSSKVFVTFASHKFSSARA